MIGYSEQSKCGHIQKIFLDAYRSPLSVLVIDDIERIIEYSPAGPRFSNVVLQTLLILIKKQPPPNCRLLILATTSIAHLLDDLQVTQSFHVCMHVSQLQGFDEIYAVLSQYPDLAIEDARSIAKSITDPIGVKQLLIVLEMARVDGTGKISPEEFMECLHTIGY